MTAFVRCAALVLLCVALAQGSTVNFVFEGMLDNLDEGCSARCPPKPDVSTSFGANLTVPLSCSGVTGVGNATLLLSLSLDGRLEWSVRWYGLTDVPNCVALHGPAYPSQNGAEITRAAQVYPGGASGSTYLYPAQQGYVRSGQVYVLVTSSRCPSGVLRGQVGVWETFAAPPPAPKDETVPLTCLNAGTCQSCGIASASAILGLDLQTLVLSFAIQWRSMPGVVRFVQFHGPVAPPGSAPALFSVAVVGTSSTVASIVLSPQQASDYCAGLWYVQLVSDGCSGLRGYIASGFVVTTATPTTSSTTTTLPPLSSTTSSGVVSTVIPSSTTVVSSSAAATTTTKSVTTTVSSTLAPSTTSTPLATSVASSTSAAGASTTAAITTMGTMTTIVPTTIATTGSTTATTTLTTTTATATIPSTTTVATTSAPTTASQPPTTTPLVAPAACPSQCIVPPPSPDRDPVTNPFNLSLSTVELLSPENPATWANTTLNDALGVVLSPPASCFTPGLRICRVYVNFPSSAFQLLGATLLNINSNSSCALSTNDPAGFFFADGDSAILGPQRTFYSTNRRLAWNANPSSRVIGDVLCSTYVTVAQGPENNAPYCVSSPRASFWNTNGTLVPDATWFCTPDVNNLAIQLGTAAVPPNGPGNTLLLAQFTVRSGYSVGGRLRVVARAAGTDTSVSTTQPFQCFC